MRLALAFLVAVVLMLVLVQPSGAASAIGPHAYAPMPERTAMESGLESGSESSMESASSAPRPIPDRDSPRSVIRFPLRNRYRRRLH